MMPKLFSIFALMILSATAACSTDSASNGGENSDNQLQTASRAPISIHSAASDSKSLEGVLTCRTGASGQYAEKLCEDVYASLAGQNRSLRNFYLACSEGYDGTDEWVIIKLFKKGTKIEYAPSHPAAVKRLKELRCEYPLSNMFIKPA